MCEERKKGNCTLCWTSVWWVLHYYHYSLIAITYTEWVDLQKNHQFLATSINNLFGLLMQQECKIIQKKKTIKNYIKLYQLVVNPCMWWNLWVHMILMFEDCNANIVYRDLSRKKRVCIYQCIKKGLKYLKKQCSLFWLEWLILIASFNYLEGIKLNFMHGIKTCNLFHSTIY